MGGKLEPRIELEYEGSKLVLALFEQSTTQEIFHWFGVSNYILLTRASEWIEPTPSERHAIFSALATALQYSESGLPAFFVCAPPDRIYRASAVLGYEVRAPRKLLNNMVRRYKSTIVDPVYPNQELYYLDGIRKIFDAQFTELCQRGGFASRFSPKEDSGTRVEIIEKYMYRHDGSAMCDPHRRARHSRVASNKDLEQILIVLSGSRVGCSSTDKISRETTATTSLLLDLSIGVHYESRAGQPPHIENGNYTNLIPSRQPPSSWSIESRFRPKPVQSPSTEAWASTSFSGCIRKLLALYIYGKASPTGATMAGIGCTLSEQEAAIVAEKASSIAVVLTRESRQALISLCNADTQQAKAIHGATSPSSAASATNLLNTGSVLSEQRAAFISRLFWQDNAEVTTTETRDEIYGNELPGSPDAGSWFSLCAIFAGCLGGGVINISSFWAECVNGLRACWETGDFTLVRSIWTTKQATKGAQDLLVPSKPLWQRSLWDDAISRLSSRGLCVCLPDSSRSLAVQRLQMLQFCVAVKAESVLCACPDEFPPPPALVGNSFDPEGSNLRAPQLLRRLPLTDDALAQQNYIAEKVISGSSRSGRENPVLAWQIRCPALVSDIRAFRAENPSSTFDQFYTWYSGFGLQMPSIFAFTPDAKGDTDFVERDLLKEIFDACDGCPAAEQRPLFRAETEAEKTIGFFESMTPVQFAAEILCVAMSTILTILTQDVADWSPAFTDTDGICDDEGISLLRQDLSLIREQMEEAVKQIRLDTAQFGVDDAEPAVSQTALIAVDAVCGLVHKMEEFCARASEMDVVLTLPDEIGSDAAQALRRRLAVSLAQQNGRSPVYASTAEEASRVFQIAKQLSRSTQDQSWEGYYSRELGVPTKKTFRLDRDIPGLELSLRYDAVDGKARMSTIHTEIE